MRNLLKIASLIIFLFALIVTTSTFVSAEQVCVSQYGGGVVCGITNPTPAPFKPAEYKAGLADFINPLTLGLFSLSASGALFLRSKRSSRI